MSETTDEYHHKFKPKTEIAVNIVKEILPHFKPFNKRIEIIVDGGYAKPSPDEIG
jgi:hypothetical protein